MLGLPKEELYRYGQWAGNPNGRKEDVSCCRYEVWPNTRFSIPYQCNRKRGHGYKGWFCKQHAKKYPENYKGNTNGTDQEVGRFCEIVGDDFVDCLNGLNN